MDRESNILNILKKLTIRATVEGRDSDWVDTMVEQHRRRMRDRNLMEIIRHYYGIGDLSLWKWAGNERMSAYLLRLDAMTGESLGLVLWLYIVVMFFPTDSTSRMLTSAAMTALGRLGPYGCLASMVISEVAALLGWYAAGITALVFIGCKPVTFIMAVLRITKMVVAGLVGRFVRWISLPIEFWRHQDGTPFRERNFEPYESESDEDRTDTPVQDTEFNLRNAGYHSGQGRNATWLMVVLFSMVLPFKFSATSSGINVNTLPVIHKVNEPVGDEKWGKIRKHSAFLVSPGPAKHDREAPVNGEVCYIKAHVWLSIDMTVGQGYVHRGNLITSSHVCPRDTIQVGSNTWHLVGRDPLRDLAIFGSERRKESIELEPMEIGDWVYSVGYEGNSWLGKKPVLYKTVVERVDDGVIFTQVPKTSPGHSGLPVFAMVNGTFKLAGVTGKYTWTSNVYEMQHVPNHNTIGSKRTILSGSVGESAFAEDLVKSSAYGLLINKEDHLGRRGMFTITGGHCGSGKTRKIIGKHLLQYHDSFQKIYVAGPTRLMHLMHLMDLMELVELVDWCIHGLVDRLTFILVCILGMGNEKKEM